MNEEKTPKFVVLTPEEVAKIREGQRPQTKEELHEINKKAASEITADDFSAAIDKIKEAPGQPKKEIREIKITVEEEKIMERRHLELIQLIREMLEKEEQKKAKGEIPEKILSVALTNNEATLTLDYFDSIVVKTFNFITKEWTEISNTPKPEFSQ